MGLLAVIAQDEGEVLSAQKLYITCSRADAVRLNRVAACEGRLQASGAEN